MLMQVEKAIAALINYIERLQVWCADGLLRRGMSHGSIGSLKVPLSLLRCVRMTLAIKASKP